MLSNNNSIIIFKLLVAVESAPGLYISFDGGANTYALKHVDGDGNTVNVTSLTKGLYTIAYGNRMFVLVN